MKNLKFSAMLILVVAFAVACGGGSSAPAAKKGFKKVDNGPGWYSNEPDNEQYLFTNASANSTDQEIAKQKAYTNAAANMARKLGAKVEALQKIFAENVKSGSQSNLDEAFTNASKTIASEKLVGLSQSNIEFWQDEQTGEYRCFIQLKLPVGDARQRLENTLSKNQELWVKFKESKAFDELSKDISRLGNEGNN